MNSIASGYRRSGMKNRGRPKGAGTALTLPLKYGRVSVFPLGQETLVSGGSVLSQPPDNKVHLGEVSEKVVMS
ncbi:MULTISPECIES: hypothetical protein [Aphanothece]|uniref:hypothetical protein n=1 Tax=Aphanothece TaxID=1121 RepID=UPI003984D039